MTLPPPLCLPSPSPPSLYRVFCGLSLRDNESRRADFCGGRTPGQSHGGGGAAEEGQCVPAGATAHFLGGGAGILVWVLGSYDRSEQGRVRKCQGLDLRGVGCSIGRLLGRFPGLAGKDMGWSALKKCWHWQFWLHTLTKPVCNPLNITLYTNDFRRCVYVVSLTLVLSLAGQT